MKDLSPLWIFKTVYSD